jgi:O-antigen/teichoic acid export membrane protein
MMDPKKDPLNMSLARRAVDNTVFGLLDQILSKVGTTAVFIILVRLLPERDIAAVGIAGAYLVLISFLDVGPIRVLLRDYPKLREDRPALDRLFSACFVFALLQAAGMLLVAFGLQWYFAATLAIPGLGFLMWGVAADFVALTYQEGIKAALYADFRQRYAATLSFALNLFRLLTYCLLVFRPTLETYTWLLIFTAVSSVLMWTVVFQRHFRMTLRLDGEIPGTLKQTLQSYGLWNHFNRLSYDTLANIDIAVLGWFGRLEELAAYTIAFKFTSLLARFPAELAKSAQVVVTNYREEGRRAAALSTFLKFNSGLSILQLVFVLAFGGWMLRLLFGPGAGPDVLYYTIILAAAITALNMSKPLVGIISALCSLRSAFLWVSLPGTVLGIAAYSAGAFLGGAAGLATAKVAVYAALAAGIALFASRRAGLRAELQLVTKEERRLISQYMGGG